MKHEDKMPGDQRISPEIHEPLETYFKSPGFIKSFKKITFSTPEEQEDSNRIFSVSLSPLQRMEYLYILNQAFLSEQMKNLPKRYTKLYFDLPT